jgi:hypothetical protein
VAVAIENVLGRSTVQDRVLWLDGMAGLLCCEPKPVSIIQAVEKQQYETKAAKRMIAKLRSELRSRS